MICANRVISGDADKDPCFLKLDYEVDNDIFNTEYFLLRRTMFPRMWGQFLPCAKRLNAVHWGVAIQMVKAWVVTIPITALIGASFFYVIDF